MSNEQGGVKESRVNHSPEQRPPALSSHVNENEQGSEPMPSYIPTLVNVKLVSIRRMVLSSVRVIN
jgi:hypothetical protein